MLAHRFAQKPTAQITTPQDSAQHPNSWRWLAISGISGVLCLLMGCTASAPPSSGSSPIASPSTEGSPTPIVSSIPALPATTLTISAAASLQEALEKISDQFKTTYPTIELTYNFGSSGSLQQQIEQGAPVDVFFSAAAKQMDALQAKDLIKLDSRRDVLGNTLVLIAPKNSTLQVTDLKALKDEPIQHFAVGEFRSVPAGQYAEQAFKKLDLLESLQPKFVFGNNVRSVLSAVATGNAEVGVVYGTDATLSDQVQVLMTVPETLHDPIRYPIAILKTTPHEEAAEAFVNFLQDTAAQKTFTDLGFIPLK